MVVRNEEKHCSDPLNEVENKCVPEKCISQGVLMQSTLPVSSNVNLFILIKWETIERSVLVIQEKATEILCNHKQGVSHVTEVTTCLFGTKQYVEFHLL